jgi:uncharacterized radical SAM protein YgiQ
VAILKRVLEKQGFSVGVIEPRTEEDVTQLGKPRLFFGITSGSIDSMLRNYNALNRAREDDPNVHYIKTIPDRAVTVYCNWVRKYFKDSPLVIGGTEATLRRFTHYDYWSNDLRKSLIFDTRADILVYGNGEKQVVEIAQRLKKHRGLNDIEGTCIRTRELPKDFILLPSHEEVSSSKEKFCDMQLQFTNYANLAQKTGNFYILQYKFPKYTSKDLDEYYELPYARKVTRELRGFEFSVVTHRGCIGNCNFCSLRLTSGDKIISRSQDSILRELKYITTLTHFKGNIDDLSAPSANMYGMDCDLYYNCGKSCIDCNKLNRTNKKLIELLQKARQVKGIKKIFIRSGIRYDLVTDDYLKELKHHISGTLKIAPEHINSNVLGLMNKNKGDLKDFIERFNKLGCGELSFYFMTAHPGSSMNEAEELKDAIKKLKNSEQVQIFTPTPMTMSTCMYYTGLNPLTKKPIYVPYTFAEKKEQKRILMK